MTEGQNPKYLSSGFAKWHIKGKTEIITVLAVKRIFFLRNLPAVSLMGFVFPTQCEGKKPFHKNKTPAL